MFEGCTPRTVSITPKHTLHGAHAQHPDGGPPEHGWPGTHPARGNFLPTDRPEATVTIVDPLSKAEATARLFANALNPLAQAGDGLNVAIDYAPESLQPNCFLPISLQPAP